MQALSFIQSLGNYVYQNIKDPYPTIPGDLQMPFVGSTYKFSRDFNYFLEQYWKTYGDIFKVRVFGANFIVLIGADANQMVLQDQQDNFLSEEPWSALIGDLFNGAIMLKDNEEHKRFRRIMQSAFHRKPMITYSEVINETVREFMDKELVDVSSEIKCYPLIEKLTLRIAGKLFFGVEFSSTQLKAITDVTRASSDPLRVKLPFTNYGKALQSRKELRQFYKDKIAQNRAKPGEDLFSYMCIARSEEGEIFTDEEIIDQMLFLMMAAHDTTTTTLVSMIYETARSTEWQEAMRQECVDLPFGDFVPYEGIKKFEQVGLVMNECLRLHPALNAFPRLATRAFSFKGHHVPAYSYIAICPKLTHLHPNQYSQPNAFDPSRFAKDRAEHKKHKFGFIPFGGGHHVCIGKYFAMMEISIIMYHLIQQFKWTVTEGYTTKFMAPLNHPKDGLIVQFKKI